MEFGFSILKENLMIKIATLAFAAVAAVCSAATLGVVVLGAKRMDDEMTKIKLKTASTLNTFKNSIEDALENL